MALGDYGDAGSNYTNPKTGGGALTASGGSNLKLPSGGAGLAGYYRIRANTTNLTWSYDKITTWGIIGAFNGWGSSVPLTFNASTGVWSITRDMPAGEFKFRANDGWTINLGITMPTLNLNMTDQI